MIKSKISLCSFISISAALILLASCGGRRTTIPVPSTHPVKHQLMGYASWYGPNFNGRRTASGEVYNMYDYTAAHKTLPFGTIVRVENLLNHKTVIVRINDRGPFKKGRILDLSYAAAKKLDMIKEGVIPVRIVILNQ